MSLYRFVKVNLRSLLRALSLWLLTVWLGGFTFYTAAVIPILHDQLGSPLETGLVTQRATQVLNLLGLVTVALGCMRASFGRTESGERGAPARWGPRFLLISAACLAALLLLHRVLDSRLETAELHDFYTIHRVYVWVSTLQWLANLGLILCWAGDRAVSPSETCPGNPQVSD
jgi:hypothetical protein